MHLPLIMLHCYLILAPLRIMTMLLSGPPMYAHVYVPTHTERDREKVRRCVAERPENVCRGSKFLSESKRKHEVKKQCSEWKA
ncbi:hypothetical protein ABVT39_018438, partial [Epinephelus coioides]